MSSRILPRSTGFLHKCIAREASARYLVSQAREQQQPMRRGVPLRDVAQQVSRQYSSSASQHHDDHGNHLDAASQPLPNIGELPKNGKELLEKMDFFGPHPDITDDMIAPRERVFAKIASAIAVFYLLYMFKDRGAVLFNLAPAHFKHPNGDEDSAEDDEDWDEIDDEELDRLVELYARSEHLKKRPLERNLLLN